MLAGLWPCPTVWRARYITNQIAEWERAGQMPQFVIICLPNDHTSGTSVGAPTPAALVADNDLAFGQIVEALSRTSFWKSMAIFGIEDDPQNGWDHISGYRTTAYVISPWAKRREVISTQYNTTSLLRTIEQILGLPPMNQFDATAISMFDCFTETPDFAPFCLGRQQHPARPDESRSEGRRRRCIATRRLRLGTPESPSAGRLSGRRAEPDSLARDERQRGGLSRLGRHPFRRQR